MEKIKEMQVFWRCWLQKACISFVFPIKPSLHTLLLPAWARGHPPAGCSLYYITIILLLYHYYLKLTEINSTIISLFPQFPQVKLRHPCVGASREKGKLSKAEAVPASVGATVYCSFRKIETYLDLENGLSRTLLSSVTRLQGKTRVYKYNRYL